MARLAELLSPLRLVLQVLGPGLLHALEVGAQRGQLGLQAHHHQLGVVAALFGALVVGLHDVLEVGDLRVQAVDLLKVRIY